MTTPQNFNNAAALPVQPHEKQQFFVAAKQNNAQALRVYIAQRPDAVHWRLGGKTALQAACEKGSFFAAQMLLNHGADANAFSDDKLSSPLHAAAELADTSILIQLIHKRGKINAANDSGTTPLMVAARRNRPEPLKVLVTHGASFSAVNHEGETALEIAVFRGSFEAAKTMLEKGCSIDIRNRNGDTALMQAAREKNLKAAKFLIENGASDELKDDLNETPLDIARSFAGGDEKFLNGFIGLLRERGGREAKAFAPEFHSGAKRGFNPRKTVRFKSGPK